MTDTSALPGQVGDLRWAPEGLPRLLPSPPATTLGDHLDRFGRMPRRPVDLIGEVHRAGLRGRGGAGFPTATKLAAVAAGRRPIVVANGTEGEPASAKDKSLLVLAPHLVLDGAVLAARAVGAREVVVCVDRSAAAALRAVTGAVAERRAAGLDHVGIEVRAAPDRYLTGEESALVHWLNGGEAKPTFVPPRPFERGVARRPTLVQNVETLANVALIARFGADWFRSVGTDADPGAVLLTVSGAVAHPGVYEVPLGVPLQAVLSAAGVHAEASVHAEAGFAAVLVGGYFGTWVPASAVAHTELAPESLRRVGASLGCGVIGVLPGSSCGLAESARVTRWLAAQNAGQCGPCVFGLDAIAGAFEALVRGDRSGRAEKDIRRWVGMVKGRGACGHPDGTARFVESSLATFEAEIARHRRSGPCPQTQLPSLFPLPAPGGWR